MNNLRSKYYGIQKQAVSQYVTDAGGGHLPTYRGYTPYDTSVARQQKQQSSKGVTDLQEARYQTDNLRNTLDAVATAAIPGSGAGKVAYGAGKGIANRITQGISHITPKANRVVVNHPSQLGKTIKTLGRTGTAVTSGDAVMKLREASNWRESQLPQELKGDSIFGYYGNQNIPVLQRRLMALRDLSNAMVNEDYSLTGLGASTIVSDILRTKSPAGLVMNAFKPAAWYASRSIRNNLDPAEAYKNLGTVAGNMYDDNGLRSLIPGQRTVGFASRLPFVNDYNNFDDPYISGTFYSALQDMISNSYNINGARGAANAVLNASKLLTK